MADATIATPNGQQTTTVINTAREAAVAAGGDPYKAAPTDFSVANTPAESPSSSSSIIMSQNGAKATDAGAAAVNGTAPAPNADVAGKIASGLTGLGYNVDSGSVQSLLDAGYDPNTVTNLLIGKSQADDAKAAADKEEAQQASTYQAELSAQNADYGAALGQLKTDRSNALNTATAQLASLNSSGGKGSDADAFMSHINDQYDVAENQLTLQGEQARDALDAGNTQAYQSIQQQMSQTIAGVKTNIQNLLSAATGNQTQQSQFAQTQYNTSLSTLTPDSPLGSLNDSSGAPVTDPSQLSAAQKSAFESSSAYQQGTKAGLSPQAILGDVQNAIKTSKASLAQSQLQEKTNNDIARAQIAMFVAQTNAADKEAAAISAGTIANSTGGGPYLAAMNAIAPDLSKAQNTTLADSLAASLSGGDTKTAKTTLTNAVLKGLPTSDQSMYGGLQEISGVVSKLRADIAALPKDQQTGFLTGNFQQIAEKVGQNPSPQLATINAEFQHIQKVYVRSVFGVRAAAAASGSSIFNSILPSITDTKSLNLSTLQGLLDTANDSLNSVVSSKISQDNFQAIYGDSGVLGTGTTTSATAPAAPTISNGVNLSLFNAK
jgi:hypothetical protein